MFPFKTSIKFDRKSNQALYLQLSNQIIQLIKNRTLVPGAKLPGSRTLADQLNVHRKTVVTSYDDLVLQGWAESIPKKGTFVHKDLPVLQHQNLCDNQSLEGNESAGFNFYQNGILPNRFFSPHDEGSIKLDDGICDARLAPLDEIARTYRRITSRRSVHSHMSYGSTYGNFELRNVLVNYLNETRGLNIGVENLLITRGSQMGIWLSSQLLLRSGDIIIVGNTNYQAADLTFLSQTANLERVMVDENGLVIEELETLCRRKSIKAVYVTSHHHHPTTVTLSAERRIHLLNLAKQYEFAIIEDDYDYDFNYNHAPILPLASHDTNSNVIYIGSLCKTVAPVFRIGYLIASKEFVDEAAKLRACIDRQGDALLELTFASFIKSGDLERHIRKVMKIYRERRDLLCDLLDRKLNGFLYFEKPIGGMAVWAGLDQKYSWEIVSRLAGKYGLEIGNWQRYDNANSGHNHIRIGFASHSEEKIIQLVDSLEKIKDELESS